MKIEEFKGYKWIKKLEHDPIDVYGDDNYSRLLVDMDGFVIGRYKL